MKLIGPSTLAHRIRRALPPQRPSVDNSTPVENSRRPGQIRRPSASHGIVIATEHGTYRLKGLKSGEVALYTDEGAKIVLKRGRIIETECDVFRVNCKTYEINASEKSDFNTPMLTASAQVTAKAKITGQGGIAVSGGSGAEVSGNMKIIGGDVSADTVTLKTLKVTNVQPGSGTSGVPVQ